MKRGVIKWFVAPSCMGMVITLLLAIFWRLVNFDYIRIPNDLQDALSGLTLLLCPPSFVLMEVGPKEAITREVGMLYAEVILSNGMLYGLVTSVGLALFRAVSRVDE